MRHFQSHVAGVAACGANCGPQSCFSRHAVVTCPRCLAKLYSLEVQCSHPDCGWKGPLHACGITVSKKRCCPQCLKAGTYERPNVNYVKDEFGTQIACDLLPSPYDALADGNTETTEAAR